MPRRRPETVEQRAAWLRLDRAHHNRWRMKRRPICYDVELRMTELEIAAARVAWAEARKAQKA